MGPDVNGNLAIFINAFERIQEFILKKSLYTFTFNLENASLSEPTIINDDGVFQAYVLGPSLSKFNGNGEEYYNYENVIDETGRIDWEPYSPVSNPILQFSQLIQKESIEKVAEYNKKADILKYVGVLNGEIVANEPICTEQCTSLSHAFVGCSALEQVGSIPANVKNINGIFKGCSSLVRVGDILCSSTTEAIDFTEAFVDCTSLTEISINGEELYRSIGDGKANYMFENSGIRKINILDGLDSLILYNKLSDNKEILGLSNAEFNYNNGMVTWTN
jgi:hypothetical protein